jgi:hypothetical protein
MGSDDTPTGQQGDQVQITENVVKATAGNWGNGKEAMTLLFFGHHEYVHLIYIGYMIRSGKAGVRV